MNKDEARAILESEHFFTVHLIKMRLLEPHPMNVCAGVRYFCAECRAENNKVRDREIAQALEVMRKLAE